MGLLELRSYQPGDEIAICSLYQASFGLTLPLDGWNWRFRDNPFGAGIIELAWDGATLAGHYAVSPSVLHYQGKDYPCALSGTTMTHPAYRGQDLFPKLGERTYDRMAKQGMAAVWGFPNRNSHRGIVSKLSWVDISEVPIFRYKYQSGALPQAKSTNIQEETDFGSEYDLFWESARQLYGIAVKRTQAYLRWRFVTNAFSRYRILTYRQGAQLGGYAVFKLYKQELQIVDLLALDTQIERELVLWAASLGLEQGMSSIGLWLNVHAPLHRQLEGLGFAGGEPMTYFGARSVGAKALQPAIEAYRSWHITMSDSDVF